MSAPDIAIRVDHLTRTFPGKSRKSGQIIANDDLTFTVRRGEIFGLLGPNGAGKTTLISQLLGLLRPTAGEIWVEGINVVQQPDVVKQHIGFLPQTGLAMRGVEVERALRYTGRLRGQTEADARAQSQELLHELDLRPYADRLVQKLSGGLMRLTHFAMALMGRPQVLVLDEPTNELDPQKRRLVWDVLARLNRNQGTTCVLVTHNVLEAEKVLQRVAVLRHGRMIALGTPGVLKQQSGERLRLEVQLKEDAVYGEDELARLAALGALDSPRPGQYRLYLMPERIAAATELVVRGLGLARLDDFRLAPPSLEDVYLELDRTHGRHE